jgi:tetratricopeptide (TPR) repeat protein
MKAICTVLFFACSISFATSVSADDESDASSGSAKNLKIDEDANSQSKKKDEGAINAGEEHLHAATRLKINSQSFGDLKEVIRLCELATSKGLDDHNLAFAKQLIASTRFERASRICEEIFDRYPPSDNWPALSQLARMDLEDAVKHQDVFAEAYLLIGRLHLLPRGNRERARISLDKAIVQSDADPAIQAMAYALRGEIRKQQQNKLDDFNMALKLRPNLTTALRARGIYYIKANEPEKAIVDFRKVANLEPDDAQIHEMLGLGLLFTNQLDDALECFNRSIEIDSERGSALSYRARIYLDQNKFDRALEDINQALNQVVDNLSWRLVRAQIYWEQKKYAEAIRELERVLAVDSKLLEAIRMRAAILAEDGQIDEAIAGLKRAVDALPTHNGLLMNLALFYASNSQTAEALEAYNKLLERSVPHAPIYRNRGDLLLNVGRQGEAIENYDKALELEQDDSGVLNNLAWVLATSPEANLRDGKRSFKLATRACEVTDYKEAHILSTLAAACAENGDFPEAIRWSTQAVALGNSEVDEQLAEELQSYEAGKPWREDKMRDEKESAVEKPEKVQQQSTDSAEEAKEQDEPVPENTSSAQ